MKKEIISKEDIKKIIGDEDSVVDSIIEKIVKGSPQHCDAYDEWLKSFIDNPIPERIEQAPYEIVMELQKQGFISNQITTENDITIDELEDMYFNVCKKNGWNTHGRGENFHDRVIIPFLETIHNLFPTAETNKNLVITREQISEKIDDLLKDFIYCRTNKNSEETCLFDTKRKLIQFIIKLESLQVIDEVIINKDK